MIRVLHYIGLLEFGGSQSFVMEIYRKIDREMLQFDFVTFPNQKVDFYDEIISLGGRVYESPRYNGKNHFEFVKWWKSFFEQHQEYRVFHCHVRSVAAICISIAHKYGCYAIAHSHSTSNGSGIISVIKDIMQFPVRFQADYMFACSYDAGKWMFGNRTIARNNFEVIFNAIDSERFGYNLQKRIQIRKKLKISDKFVIGHVGRFTEPKNHMFLLEVFSEVLKERDNACLLLIGDGEKRSEIERKINELRINDSVILAGSKSNTCDYYQAMDVFAFPSLWEGLGMAAIEAQASGLHCVVSERIPKEVDIGASLICAIELDKGIKIWKDNIVSYVDAERSSHIDEVKTSGYDVVHNAKKMQDFYLTVNKNTRNERT